jgi:hypothetical protein
MTYLLAILSIYTALVALAVFWVCRRRWSAWGRALLAVAVALGLPLAGVGLLFGLDWHGSGWGIALIVAAILIGGVAGLAVGWLAYAIGAAPDRPR